MNKSNELLRLSEGHDDVFAAVSQIQWTPQLSVMSQNDQSWVNVDLTDLVVQLTALGITVSSGENGLPPTSLMLQVDGGSGEEDPVDDLPPQEPEMTDDPQV